MPLRWQSGGNPFRHSFFSILKCGPYATPQEIVQHSRRRSQELRAGEKNELLDIHLDDYLINGAARELRDPATRAEEMLLAHPPALKDKTRLKSIFAQIDKVVTLPAERPPIELVHPLGVLWFLPPPKPEAAAMPPWADLELGQAGDSDDLAMDVVFDH